jgi:ferric-dicitrate binding protein FerR (iron transport regulator)
MRSSAVLILCCAGAVHAQSMTASLVEGTATVQSAGAQTPSSLVRGAALKEGDTVSTEADSRVEITLPEGSLLRLGENTRTTLAAHSTGKKFSATLLFGNLWAKVEKLVGGQTFEIETENGVSGVRGTEFRVESAKGQDDLVRVYDGAVQTSARDGAWSHRIEPGNELRFRRGVVATGPRRFDPASERNHKFMSWVRSRPLRNGTRPGQLHRGPGKQKPVEKFQRRRPPEKQKGAEKERKRKHPR